jgi:5-methylcytosine-specific restriction endonuclease McrA
MKRVLRPYRSRQGSTPSIAWGSAYRRERRRVLASSPEVCALCGGGPRPYDPWETDHRISAAFGGRHSGNLQRAHRSCNRAKGAATARAKRR